MPPALNKHCATLGMVFAVAIRCVPAALPGEPVDVPEFRVALDPYTAAEIDHLLPLLGSPQYAERASATTRLIEIGVPALTRLHSAYHATDDLEVRLRIETIVQEAYLGYHVYDRHGFLGIAQGICPTHAEDPRIPEGHAGVTVSKVLAGTAAEAVGLKVDDVIIALDGEPLAEGRGPLESARIFGESIRRRPPGTRLMLSVLRGDQTLTVEATLGRRGKEHYGSYGPGSGQPDEGAQMLIRARRDFVRWWAEHFRPGNTGPP